VEKIDRYRVLDVLQRTPLGCVYSAEDSEAPGCRVLVKELVPCEAYHISEDEIKDRFERELDILRHLTHPAIPKLRDHAVTGSTYTIVIDFHDGETLDAISLKRKDPFPVKLVVKWGLQICAVLSLFHHHTPQPIIFRDITPSNIVITAEGDVRLADFGITRYFNPSKVKDTFVMGTAGFSPPEQYGKEQSDGRSDIYSLGATLFYLLTLRSPDEFTGKLLSAGARNTLVPSLLAKVIQKCLGRDRLTRYQTVEALAEDLRKSLQ
jgi:serine/threonine protein kinase